MPPSIATCRAASAELLAAAIARTRGCTFSVSLAGDALLRRARMVSADADDVRLVLANEEDAGLAQQLAAIRAPLSVSLRTDLDELVFFSEARAVEMEGAGARPVLVMPTPAEVVATRRRRTVRIGVLPEDPLSARIWRIDNYVLVRDRPLPSQELRCELRDISTGGIRVLVHAQGTRALRLLADQRFRIELKWDETSLLLEGRLRHPRETNRDDASALCGIAFVERASDIECRRSLQRLESVIAQLQRIDARRNSAA